MTAQFILLLLVLVASAVILSFLSGKRKGHALAREEAFDIEKGLQRKALSLDSVNKDLQQEIETLSKKAEKYLYFLVRLPEAVKQINSNLSFDGLITAVIRLARDLTGTEAVEIYIFNEMTERLRLVAAYGTNRGKSVEIKLGEGLVGKAASMKTIISRGHPGIHVPESEQAGIDTVTPILFKDSLLGAVAIGKMKSYTGNEKRFLAMISDLMAVALNNINHLAHANEEATRDALTGLYNKKFFLERAIEVLHSSASYDFSFSIFMFDIDHFKNYNDTNGHVQGDIVLKEIGRLLRENTRSTNVTARYGGEEFILLIDNIKNHDALKCAESIRGIIECHKFPFGEKQPLGCISISGGVATYPFDGQTVEEVIQHADEALYISKASGRNRITKYVPRMLSQAE